MFNFRIIIGLVALLSLNAVAEEQEKCGPYDGVNLTSKPELLNKILESHNECISKTPNDLTCRAKLCKAILREADPNNIKLATATMSVATMSRATMSRAGLGGANLRRANLRGADLRGADLSGADLSAADLSAADLSAASLLKADLSAANLFKADLSGANLIGADLSAASLLKADLSAASLLKADLSGANLIGANLRGADLHGANLKKATLHGANLKKATLHGADLGGANLRRANLRGADLSGADLSGADLSEANLIEANLSKANLTKAIIIKSDLKNAKTTNTIFTSASYDPISIPAKAYLGGIKGISSTHFDEGNHTGLVTLRAALKEIGLRELEREATYAIESGKTRYSQGPEKWLRLIFFEWTSNYGLNYERPILILLCLLLPFAAVYYFSIAGYGSSRVYRVWSEERIEEDAPTGSPERHIEPLTFNIKKKPLKTLLFSIYFSILSAFHIGWRDLNVGNWITRLQPREYTFQAKGWVKTVSGLQSLISIYLLALWVLVYFGRPFQ